MFRYSLRNLSHINPCQFIIDALIYKVLAIRKDWESKHYGMFDIMVCVALWHVGHYGTFGIMACLAPWYVWHYVMFGIMICLAI